MPGAADLANAAKVKLMKTLLTVLVILLVVGVVSTKATAPVVLPQDCGAFRRQAYEQYASALSARTSVGSAAEAAVGALAIALAQDCEKRFSK